MEVLPVPGLIRLKRSFQEGQTQEALAELNGSEGRTHLLLSVGLCFVFKGLDSDAGRRSVLLCCLC